MKIRDFLKKEIERSIIKKFRRQIWSKFVRAINDYKLINNGDKIAVCISGGKRQYFNGPLFS